MDGVMGLYVSIICGLFFERHEMRPVYSVHMYNSKHCKTSQNVHSAAFPSETHFRRFIVFTHISTNPSFASESGNPLTASAALSA